MVEDAAIKLEVLGICAGQDGEEESSNEAVTISSFDAGF
jgi:hypothetical protein